MTLFLDIAVAAAAAIGLGVLMVVSVRTLRAERRADREAAWHRLEQLTADKEGL